MTEKSYPYKFKSDKLYTSDLGATSNFNLSVKAPSDLTEDVIKKIIECVGEERDAGSVPCSERGIITPRKVTFIRENGNSLSLVFPLGESLITDAKCVWDILNGSSNKPICAKLIGEHHKDILADLNISEKEGESIQKKPIIPPKDAGKHKLIYSGTMKEYKSDSVKSGKAAGGVIFQPFIMQSDTEPNDKGVRQPYSQLKDQIVGCHGNLTTVRTCGGNTTKRVPRHVIPNIAVEIVNKNNELNPIDNTSTEALQTLMIPIADNTAAKIKDCAEKIGKFNWVICLEYYGESYGLFHKVLT